MKRQFYIILLLRIDRPIAASAKIVYLNFSTKINRYEINTCLLFFAYYFIFFFPG